MTEAQYEKEVESLEQELENGFITRQKFNQYLKELDADMQEEHGYDDFL